MKPTLYAWESQEAFIADLKTRGLRSTTHYHRSDSWFANKTVEQAFDLALVGHNSYVDKAQKLLESVPFSQDTYRDEWTPQPFGAYPIVPEYLACDPLCMRAITPQESERGPVTMYYNITASASWDSETLLKRGVTMLALLERLQTERPVELYITGYFEGRRVQPDFAMKVRVETRPMNLSQIGYLIADASYIRHLWWEMVWNIKETNCDSDSIGWGQGRGNPKWQRQTLQANAEDIVIDMAYATDGMVTQPVVWLKNQLDSMRASDAR
jgi:hypothetical protein